MAITNQTMTSYDFLREMSLDSYFPANLVKKGQSILLNLCLQIEQDKPENLDQLYALTHAATDKFNDLSEEFEEQDSEIETAARECIGQDFEKIAQAYGFQDADTEELIATRDW